MGTYISGPKVGPNDFVGKVVIFDYWGSEIVNLKNPISHLSRIAELADTDELIIISSQVQAKGQTKDLWTKNGGSEKIQVVDGGGIPSAQVSTIPKTFIFDHNGKMVYDGYPHKIDLQFVKKLLADAPGPLLEYGYIYITCSAEAAALKNVNTNIAPVLKSLRKKKEKGDDETKAEAQRILNSVYTYLFSKQERIEAMRSTKPLEASKLLQHMVMFTKGDEFSKPFEAILKEVKTDKTFMSEVTAAQALDTLKIEANKIGLDRGDVKAATNSKANNILMALEQVIKKFPNTIAAKEAMELITKWGS